MKRFITQKEIKANIDGLHFMRYAQQWGGLDEEYYLKEIGGFEICVDFKKERNFGRYSYHLTATICDIWDGKNPQETFFEEDYDTDELSALVADLNSKIEKLTKRA